MQSLKKYTLPVPLIKKAKNGGCVMFDNKIILIGSIYEEDIVCSQKCEFGYIMGI